MVACQTGQQGTRRFAATLLQLVRGDPTDRAERPLEFVRVWDDPDDAGPLS